MTVRKILTVLTALLLLLPAAALAQEETLYYRNPDTGFFALIEDEAGLLNSQESTEVLEQMKEITAFCSVGCYIPGGNSSTYIASKAKAWGEQTFGTRADYTMFVIDMGTRRLGVFSGGKILETVTTQRSNTIADNVYRLASKGEYGECAREAFRQIFYTLKGEHIPETMRYAGNALLALLAAILLAYKLISARMEQEVKVTLPEIVTATAGAGAVIVGKKLSRVVHHQRSSGGGGGFGGGGGGGGSFGGGSHGF